MKFACNHTYKFKDYRIAFMSGFLQTTMVFTVELVNLASILNNTTTIDVVVSFLALAIIAEFDNFFFEALGENKDKDILTEAGYEELLWTVRKTSSSQAHGEIEGNKLSDPAYTYLKDPKF